MSDESRKFESELKAACKEMFPLAEDRDLPWAACQLRRFLEGRIAAEVENRVQGFTERVIKVLIEISPLKQYPEDMARIVVDRAKQSQRLEKEIEVLREKLAKTPKET